MSDRLTSINPTTEKEIASYEIHDEKRVEQGCRWIDKI